MFFSSIGGLHDMDHIVTKETHLIHIAPTKDLCVLELRETQTFCEKDFIVPHQSSVHFPYETT
jgi:hypothetical protein